MSAAADEIRDAEIAEDEFRDAEIAELQRRVKELEQRYVPLGERPACSYCHVRPPFHRYYCPWCCPWPRPGGVPGCPDWTYHPWNPSRIYC